MLCLLITVVVFALTYGFFEPRWETNDDAAMSMVAHGYGIAAQASANLIFSNVLWGHIVQTLPSVNGVLGYSVATVCTLVVSMVMMLYVLRLLGVSILASTAAVALIFFVRPYFRSSR